MTTYYSQCEGLDLPTCYKCRRLIENNSPDEYHDHWHPQVQHNSCADYIPMEKERG